MRDVFWYSLVHIPENLIIKLLSWYMCTCIRGACIVAVYANGGKRGMFSGTYTRKFDHRIVIMYMYQRRSVTVTCAMH